MAPSNLLIDDAITLLTPNQPYNGPDYPIGVMGGGGISNVASFKFPPEWDKARRKAVVVIIRGAVQHLAQRDPLYSEELGSAQFENDWRKNHEDYCHYVTTSGAITPALDKVRHYVNMTLRHEFANPEHWQRYKAKTGTHYLISQDPCGFPSIIEGVLYQLLAGIQEAEGLISKNDARHVAILPDGKLDDWIRHAPMMVVQFPTHREDGIQMHDVDPKPRNPIPGIDLSEAMAKRLLPYLGVEVARIKDSPRQIGG
jgi:hypothetical protein